MKKSLVFILLATFALAQSIPAQTVNIKFRYQPQAAYTRVHFPGQFNNWGPNSFGTILAGAVSQADSLEAATGLWVKTVPLAFGTYQYKIYRQFSTNATDWSWIPDPANIVIIPPDQNSQFVVDSLVLFQLFAYPYTIETGTARSKFVVKTGLPSLSAGIFQPAGSPVLKVNAFVDSASISNAINYFDSSSGIFTYKPLLAIPDGIHTFKIIASAGSQSRTDSVQFEVRGRAVQIQTPPFTTRKNIYITAGFILKPDGSGVDTSVTSVSLSVNGVPKTIPVTSGNFLDSTFLVEGINLIKVVAPNGKDSVVVKRIVNHTPYARASVPFLTTPIPLSAAGSTDPDSQALTFKWFDDPATPLGLDGRTGVNVSVAKPTVSGEYYYQLVATDPDGNSDTTRSYFTIKSDGSLENPGIASNPEWAKRARVYFLFPKAFTQAGTISAATQRLQYVKNMGFNVIWMMPVMKNASPINQGSGPGYNITDFYNVAPEYGTNQDFKDFVAQAHSLGLKVILDVTPNHTSRFHPWSEDAHANKLISPYWNWYEHHNQPTNPDQTNGLGSSLDADGFNYYSGFSDQLLNYNWRDIDAQAEMINVYKNWVREFGLDGYRFDVYWGPHRRYGDQYMGKPVRDALKHMKPDILLLAEDGGTGSGTEAIYADYSIGGINGGVDAAYDFNLYFNQIRGFVFSDVAVNSLHNGVFNSGYYPGPNSLFMRFMESQDEDRIVYFYSTGDPTSTFMKTMPMASVIFTAPGFPMIWNGQEVGWGYGISGSKEARNRSTINWDFQGKLLLTPHYQRLAWIRGTLRAFATQKMIRLSTGNGLVYGFTRPFDNANAIALMNFSSSPSSTTITLTGTGVPNVTFTGGVQDGKTYYMNDVYNDTSYAIIFLGGSADFSTTLPAYGSAIYVLSDSLIKLKVPSLTGVDSRLPLSTMPIQFSLDQNYPNPFNPTTHFRFAIAQLKADAPLAHDLRFVSLKVYDVLGREVATLVNGEKEPGVYEMTFNAARLSSGVYYYRLSAGSYTEVKRMMLLK